MNVHPNCSLAELQRIVEGFFFPNGTSFLGNISEMEKCTGNYKEDPLQPMIEVSGSVVPFTIARYADKYMLNRIRIYQLTKRKADVVKSCQSLVPTITVLDSDDDNADDINDLDFTTSTMPCSKSPATLEATETSTFMGTIADRAVLRGEMDATYLGSLLWGSYSGGSEIDFQGIGNDAVSAKNLKEECLGRVPAESSTGEAHYNISVRHLTLGMISRTFSEKATL